MQKLAPTFNLTTIACKFGTVLLCVIELLTRSHLKFCFLINVFKIASCGNWLLAVSWHAVQYLRQRVIIYCKDQHSSQCSNWKLYWSCKYSTLFFAATGVFCFSAFGHSKQYSPGLLSNRASVTQTAPKQAIQNNKKTRLINKGGDILFHAQVLFMLHSLAYTRGRSIEHQQMPRRNGQQHILFTTSWKQMDLFGSAPNLKCSNEAVCYNAAASPLSYNRLGSRLGFECIVLSILLVDNKSQSSSVLLDTKCYSA